MSVQIPDLWPPINVNMVMPVAVLKKQAGLISQKTKGILEADVMTASTGGKVQHTLDLIAPALKRRRVTILSATHDEQQIYPVRIEAACFDTRDVVAKGSLRNTLDHALTTGLQPDERRANSQEELVELVKQVLQSGQVRSIISSLVIESNQNDAKFEAGDNSLK